LQAAEKPRFSSLRTSVRRGSRCAMRCTRAALSSGDALSTTITRATSRAARSRCTHASIVLALA